MAWKMDWRGVDIREETGLMQSAAYKGSDQDQDNGHGDGEKRMVLK